MATVELSFSALPVHVRTARLIVTAVARRSGVAEALLDEVRLAVGEACSRAVEAHRRRCPDEPVRLELSGTDRRFEVVVSDAVSADDAASGLPDATPLPEPSDGGKSGADGRDVLASDTAREQLERIWGGDTAELGLAVIAGLADDVDISATPKGVQIRMSWPVESEPSPT
ncbi:anti-sigma regulatory factor [Actinomadura sp. NBRC 104412]|nr:ATP-binding protein [Actinomadura sp. NBRC 104412]GLZ09689.1 anti-sigma regulatory factor [Actinomadura sp. NBRC 104412]